VTGRGLNIRLCRTARGTRTHAAGRRDRTSPAWP